jgi:ATP-binding cassette, subfamily C (CFTR/MRP), member 1
LETIKNSVPQESPQIIYDNRPPKDWPRNGNIKFENKVPRYQDFGVDVLKDITINIKAKEKIGIVSRNGSGHIFICFLAYIKFNYI